MKKRGQHYVWRYYLRAWAPNDQIQCLRNGKIYSANIRDVANQRDFYRLRELTPQDIALIDQLAIQPSPKVSQDRHRQLVRVFSLIASTKAKLDDDPSTTPEVRAQLDEIVNNTEEDLHAGIESRAIDALRAMLEGDTGFFHDDQAVIPFFHFLGIQMLRTKRFQDKMIALSTRANNPIDYFRIGQVLRHIYGSNIGGSLYVERKNHRLVLLNTPEDVQLLTNDHPVVNTCATHDEFGPDELEIYYPISPTKAMLLTPKITEYETGHRKMTPEEAAAYNRLIVNNAHEQIFSVSQHQLAELVKEA